jgi:hypothetical protein
MTTFEKRLLAVGITSTLTLLTGYAIAHDLDEAGQPVCTEGNYMMADPQNAPFAANGPGRVIEMNIFTGTPGITTANPFTAANKGTDICPADFDCPGPWKPTGVLSGGLNGHAFISSAGQQGLTELHRDGNPIRTVSYKSLTGNPAGSAGYGTAPRPLGTQFMPNGNIIQAICDANFDNASNSDPIGTGDPDPGGNGNSSFLYFPPVYTTPRRNANSRLLVIDQETLQVIDEYSQPAAGEPGHDLWGCAAGIIFSSEGMLMSTFHGAAVLVIDWKAGLDENSTGVGSNGGFADDDGYHSAKDRNKGGFKPGRKSNRAKVTRVIDMRPGAAADDPSRRDSLRAISFDESGNLYATDRVRSRDCLKYEAPGANVHGETACNPSVFRQRVDIVPLGESSPTRTLALDPGVNVIAGLRTNRMSGPGCEFVKAHKDIYATEYNLNGYAAEEDLCDVETLLVSASAMNPGEILNPGGCVGGNPANACFKPGGSVVEYLIHPNFVDGATGPCTGDPADPASNSGCAQPIARFAYRSPDDGPEIPVDPRMLMVIHEGFVQ